MVMSFIAPKTRIFLSSARGLPTSFVLALLKYSPTSMEEPASKFNVEPTSTLILLTGRDAKDSKFCALVFPLLSREVSSASVLLKYGCTPFSSPANSSSTSTRSNSVISDVDGRVEDKLNCNALRTEFALPKPLSVFPEPLPTAP